MSSHCCNHAPAGPDPAFRRALWIALWLNAAMFAVELGAGVRADSTSLVADAADFLGDAVNYALGLGALALAAVWRSRVALFKGATMALYGAVVLALALWNGLHGAAPHAATMGAIGALALAVNAGVAVMLYAFRSGDANMRSVWLCSRNDAIGNVAVLLAALGVFGSGTMWPDLAVAALMGTLGLASGWQVMRAARRELVRERRILGLAN